MSRLAPCMVKHFTAWALILLYRCFIEISSLEKDLPLNCSLELLHNFGGCGVKLHSRRNSIKGF